MQIKFYLLCTTEISPKELGKKVGRLKRKREISDYDDFYVAALDEAQEQMDTVEYVLNQVEAYLNEKNVFD